MNINRLPPQAKGRIGKLPAEKQRPLHTYEGRHLTEVRCALCETPVAGLVPREQPLSVEKKGAQTIITKLAVMSTFPNYRQITIEFDDGSAHITTICNNCLGKLNLSTLEEVYLRDLVTFADEEERSGGKADWHALTKRVPIDYTVND